MYGASPSAMPAPGAPPEPVSQTPVHREIKTRRLVPAEAVVEQQGHMATFRLPLRAERVRLEKRVVVVEEATVRRERLEGIAHARTSVRRERVRVVAEGELEVTQPLGPDGPDTLVAARPRRPGRGPRR